MPVRLTDWAYNSCGKFMFKLKHIKHVELCYSWINTSQLEKKYVGKVFPGFQDENVSNRASEIFEQQARCNGWGGVRYVGSAAVQTTKF